MEENVIMEAESKTKEQEVIKTIDYEMIENSPPAINEKETNKDLKLEDSEATNSKEKKPESTTTVFQNPHNHLESISTIENVCKKSDTNVTSSSNLVSKIDNPSPIRRKKRIQSASLACGLGENVKLDNGAAPITSIFSVSGAQSRKIYRRQPISANNIFPSAEIEIGSKEEEPPFDKASVGHLNVGPEFESKGKLSEIMASGKGRPASAFRNPLTGLGVSSRDENKSKGSSKRADGNPLLGTGYVDDRPASRNQRVPPGGYAHKLW